MIYVYLFSSLSFDFCITDFKLKRLEYSFTFIKISSRAKKPEVLHTSQPPAKSILPPCDARKKCNGPPTSRGQRRQSPLLRRVRDWSPKGGDSLAGSIHENPTRRGTPKTASPGLSSHGHSNKINYHKLATPRPYHMYTYLVYINMKPRCDISQNRFLMWHGSGLLQSISSHNQNDSTYD